MITCNNKAMTVLFVADDDDDLVTVKQVFVNGTFADDAAVRHEAKRIAYTELVDDYGYNDDGDFDFANIVADMDMSNDRAAVVRDGHVNEPYNDDEDSDFD